MASCVSEDQYDRIVSYCRATYDAPVYAVGGRYHPCIFFPASERQTAAVDSVLGALPSATVSGRESFEIYQQSCIDERLERGSHMFNGVTFIGQRIRSDDSGVVLEAAHGCYFDNIATSYALDREMRSAFVRCASADELEQILPLRASLHETMPPDEVVLSGVGRSGAIGGAVLVVFKDDGCYRCLLNKRIGSNATGANQLHVLPAFIFQPAQNPATPREWSFERAAVREYAEELFGMEEMLEDMDEHPAVVELRELMAAGSAVMNVVGVAINLFTLRPELLAVLVIHTPAWWRRATCAGEQGLKFAFTESAHILTPSIASDSELLAGLPPKYHLNMPPQAVVSLWEGVRAARRILEKNESR